MGIITSIFERLFKKEPKKVLMVGLYASGKTTILYKLKDGHNIETIPTIGFNLETIKDKNTSLAVWDLAGHTRAWRLYYSTIDAIIFVIDSGDRTCIEDAKQELHGMLEAEELKECILLVFANKQDLPNAMSTDEIVEQLKLNSITNIKLHIQAGSAIQGFGLYEGLEFLSNELS